MYIRFYDGKYFGMLTSVINVGEGLTGKVPIKGIHYKASLIESGKWSQPQKFDRYYPASYSILLKIIEDNFLADWTDSGSCLFNIVEPGEVFEKEYQGIHNDIWEG